MKRAIDITGALFLIALATPVFAACALWLRFRAGSPVLFRQRRLGRNGIPFECLKFRTMCRDAQEILERDPALRARYQADGYKLAVDVDPRIIRGAGWLRISGLDELPQLFNVLRGDMSLAGPRPIVPEEAVMYGGRTDILLSVRPGLTGPWVIAPGPPPYPQRADLEVAYATTWTLTGDLVILAKTIFLVLRRAISHTLTPGRDEDHLTDR